MGVGGGPQGLVDAESYEQVAESVEGVDEELAWARLCVEASNRGSVGYP